MRRHDHIFVDPAAWHWLIEGRADIAADTLVAPWVAKGWPLIGRRTTIGERTGVPLGLSLPPFAGRKRLSFLMQNSDIVSIARPPVLSSTIPFAPATWWPTLFHLARLASRHSAEARVFGSLAWQTVTRLDYLTPSSDIDLLLSVTRDTDLLGFARDLARTEATAPMRLDGEFVRCDGAAVNWREFLAGQQEVLVKTVAGISLVKSLAFLSEGADE